MGNLPMLKFQELHKADIILTTARNHPVSAAIRTATNSIVSHSMMVINNVEVIESVTEGVRVATWDIASKEATLAIVMRYIQPLGVENQDKIIEAAQKYKGRKYDAAGAIGSGLYGNRRNQILGISGCVISVVACSIIAWKVEKSRTPIYMDDKFFCSELVTRAYRDAGFPITEEDPTNVSPCGVYNSRVIKPVGYLINVPPPSPNLTKEQFERNRKSGYRKDY